MSTIDSTVVTIDAAGRVVIPKAVRDDLRLAPGDLLSLDADGERLTLRPVRSMSPMHKERDIWVFSSGRRISSEETNQALGRARRERERS